MIVTIDGPAGAGKSTAARKLAQRLGFCFLDTGAMYRAVALAALERNLDWEQGARLAELACGLAIEANQEEVLLDGRDVTADIRAPAVTAVIHHVADNPAVRRRLVTLQRQAAEGRDIVTEGRDQGTVAFPDADCKIFLTASAAERARRRLLEFQRRGEQMTLDQVLAQQNERDQRDSQRPVGRLLKAADAVEVITDGMDPDQVLDRLEQIVRAKMPS